MEYIGKQRPGHCIQKGPKEMAKLIRTGPPAAVVVGLEWQALEEPLIRTAVGPGWYSKAYGDTGVVAYFPP